MSWYLPNRKDRYRLIHSLTEGLSTSTDRIYENGLARYARIRQEACLVPIFEPNIFIDGDYDNETTAKFQDRVFTALVLVKPLRSRQISRVA